MGRHFTIRTDQQAIKHFMNHKLTTVAQQKWMSKLLGFDYSIEYRRGRDNVVADPLSRLHDQQDEKLENEAQVKAISIVILKWR